jgi:hypothetical protein
MIKAVLNDPTKLGTAFVGWTRKEMDPNPAFPQGATLWTAKNIGQGWQYRIYETPSPNRKSRLPSSIILDSPWEVEVRDSAAAKSEFLHRATVILVALGIGEGQARDLMVKIGNQLPPDGKGEAEHTLGPYRISAGHSLKGTLGLPELLGFNVHWGQDPDIGRTAAPTPTATFNELKSQALTLSYDDLFRNNEQHKGKVVTFFGQVVQTNNVGKDKYLLRVNVSPELRGFWKDDVRVDYSGPRILEDDIVEFVGSVEGLWTYTAVLGNERTIPHIRAIQLLVPGITPKPTSTAIPTQAPTPTLNPQPTRTPIATLSPTGIPPASPIPPPLPSGLVGWWPGDGNANDAVGRNHGTLTGGTTFSTGKVGQAFSFVSALFDGIRDSVNLGNAPDLHLAAGEFTMAAWVHFNVLQGDMSILDKMSSSRGPNFDGWRLLKQRDNRFWFCLGGLNTNGCEPDGPTTVRSSTGARVAVWVHVAAIKGSSTISIYLNGVLEEEKPLGPFIDTHSANLLIGANAFEGAHLNGLVDEVAVFNRSLSPPEIKAIYDTGSTAKVNP